MANMHFKADLLPNSDLGYSLGSTDKKWKINGINNPLLSDENVSQTNTIANNPYRILLSGNANDTTETTGTNKSTNLRFNPSTKVFSVGGDITATGDLTLTGDAYLNNETYADSITAGSLLVTGAASFTNYLTAPTPATTSNDTTVATTAFVKAAFTANDAMVFKGTLGTDGTVTALPATHSQGWTYRVITAGTYAGQVCEIGDLIICITDGTAANDAHWTVAQTNIDGAVTGPVSATTDNIAIFSNSSGRIIADSAKSFSTSAPDSSSSDATIPTSKAVWSAITLGLGTLDVSSVGGTGKYISAISQSDGKISATATDTSVSNSWTDGTTAGPKITTTVNGVNGTAVAIPSASTTVSGIITTNTQTVAGNKFTSGKHIGLISGGESDQFLDFAYAADPTASKAPGASWRVGALNSGSGDTNYFVIQTGGSDTNSTTWSNAIRIGMNTLDIAFGGNVYPLTNNAKTLGTANNKWSTVYATLFNGSGADLTNLNASNISSGTLTDARLPGVSRTNNTSTASPAHSGTFTAIDSITTDTYGRVTAVNTKTVTLPSDNNTDTKVNVIARGTTKSYILGDTTTPPSTATAHTAVAETGIYMTTTAGELSAVRYSFNINGTEQAYITFNSTTNALDFIFA